MLEMLKADVSSAFATWEVGLFRGLWLLLLFFSKMELRLYILRHHRRVSFGRYILLDNELNT